MPAVAETTDVNHNYVKSNIAALAKLPAPDETFTSDALTGDVTAQSLKKYSVITAVGRTRREYDNENGGGHRDVTVWKLTAAGHAQIQAVLDGEYSNKLPCSDAAPHTGFTNIGDGKYECTTEGCEAVHDRETIERVFGGGH
jgi:hypothetical protein